MGLAPRLASSLTSQSCLPVLVSKARKRESLEGVKSSPPAVAAGPAPLTAPTFCLPSGRRSLMPRTVCQAISPVLALIAYRCPHGGLLHGKPPAVKPEYGPGPETLPRS